MNALLASLPESARNCIEKASMPRRVSPMLATLTHEPFSSDEWIFERKLDGVRCLLFRDSDGVRLFSRNGLDFGKSFPELLPVVQKAIGNSVVADGEIVAFDGNVTSFSRLQQRLGIDDPEKAKSRNVAVELYLFDILYFDGYDVTRVPLRARKKLLRVAFEWQGKLHFTQHRNRRGKEWLTEVCRKGWEGLIAKRADSAYVETRSRDWQKFKCTAGQELVIGGFTEPRGSRVGFGALLLGYYEDGRLRYAGKVGTGFDDDLLEALRDRLDALEAADTPFDDDAVDGDAHFVEPCLVAEIGFTEWTSDGKLRHPRFLGLRHDKNASEVRREG
jgi:bifunctional non-homologous end joining protein LigD